MTLEQETKIVNECVKKAARQHRFQKEAAEHAARLANKKGVNIQKTPYVQEIFWAALDQCEFDPDPDEER